MILFLEIRKKADVVLVHKKEKNYRKDNLQFSV